MVKVILKKAMAITLSMLLALSVMIIQPQKFEEFSTYAATNEQVIYDFLKNELGLNTAAACGVLANIEKESSFTPDIIEYGYSWENGGGYGICQWTNSPRKSSTGRRTNLVNFCNSRGYNYKTLTGQLYFLKYELETDVKPGVYNYLKQVSNTADGAYDAGWKWCYSFEVPADRSNVSVTRGNLARDKYWSKYSGQNTNDTELGIPYPRPSGSPLLQVGSKGNSVKWLQTALNKYMNAGLSVDGDFGNGTKTAVKNFQSKCGLSVDGIAGPATIKKLVECLRAKMPQTTTTKATTKTTKQTTTTTKTTTNYSTNYNSYTAPTRTLIYQTPNMSGNDVRWFQCAINYLIINGDNNSNKLPTSKLNVDGYYGNASKTACIDFQKKYGLSQDGMFGPASVSKMKQVLAKKTTTTTKKTTTTTKKTTTTAKKTTAKTTTTNYSTNYNSYSAPTRTLIYQTPNMSGSDVKWFQCAINYLIIKGDKNGSKLSTSKLNVDGYYGNASKTACIAFQKKYGLSQDGMFGPASVSKMKEMLKKTTTTTKKTTTTTKKKTTTTTKKKTTTTKKKTTTTKKKTTTTKKKTTTTKKKTTTTAKKTTAKTTTTNYSTNYNSYSAPTRTLIYQTPNMSGNDVRWFQCAINYLIIKGDKNGSKLSTSKLNVDGYYGNASKTACIAFQKKYGLTQDGKFGSASLSKMKEMLKKTTTTTKKTTTTTKKKTTTTKKKTTTTKKKTTTTKKKTTTTKKKTTTTKKSTTTTKKATTTTYNTNFKSYTVPTRNLSYNSSSIMTGNDVKWFQSAINYLIIKGDRYGNKLSTSKLTVNGSYNSASKTACIAFQKKYGLDADGVFGPNSRTRMKYILNLMPPVAEYLEGLSGTESKEWGSSAGTQCVELPKYYMENYFGLANRYVTTGNGNQMYYMVPQVFPNEFKQINYSKGMKFYPGDILSLTSGSKYGHAVIVYKVEGNTLTCIEQYSTTAKIISFTFTITDTNNGYTNHRTYKQVLGVARHKDLK